MSAVAYLPVEMVSAGNCWSCGVPVYLPRAKYDSCQRDHAQSFHCCNGHSAVFAGKTEAQLLREELDKTRENLTKRLTWAEQNAIDARQQRDAAHRQASAARGQVTRIKNRVGNGVCPCCKRTFKQLAAHMACKHPEFKDEGADQ